VKKITFHHIKMPLLYTMMMIIQTLFLISIFICCLKNNWIPC